MMVFMMIGKYGHAASVAPVETRMVARGGKLEARKMFCEV
jgi:hypothetical protein